MRIAIVAAEASGDLLGAGLMRALQRHCPNARFEGIGGPRMAALGIRSLAPMETLSVMGLVEVLRHLPRLLRLRRSLRSRWLSDPPDLFIGVDAPDFNLTLEQHLRRASIPTVHYVSPTVWAWREGRVAQLRSAADLLLSIFPFEKAFLEQRGVNAAYVGHTLAGGMPMEPDRDAARRSLGIVAAAPVLALLPGSRHSEIERLARPFLETALICSEQLPGLRVVTPLASKSDRSLWRQQRQLHAPELEIVERLHASRQMLAAADVVLTASGTATFEALLSKRPMVVGYKLNRLTYLVAKWLRLVKLEHVAMANLLAGEELAPEFIQDACEAERLAPAVMNFFQDPGRVEQIVERYRELHRELAVDTDERAAQAVLGLLRDKGKIGMGQELK